VLDRPSKTQLIWSRQTITTSLSSASKTGCFCYVIFSKLHIMNF